MVVIIVTLPISKTNFLAVEKRYIESVAATAEVVPANVEILSIEEIYTNAARRISMRQLLAIFVRVNTSILLAIGQETNLDDESALNFNLELNGLPPGIVLVQQAAQMPGVLEPEPNISDSSHELRPDGSSSEPAPVSMVFIGIIVGCSVALCGLLGGCILVYRKSLKGLLQSTTTISEIRSEHSPVAEAYLDSGPQDAVNIQVLSV